MDITAYRKLILLFLIQLKGYFSFRQQSANSVGSRGTAGEIRAQSEKIYLYALGQLEVIINNFVQYSLGAILGFMHSAKDALKIESTVDQYALDWTPPEYTAAREAHLQLKEDTDGMQHALDELYTNTPAEPTVLEIQAPLFTPSLVAQRQERIEQYINMRKAQNLQKDGQDELPEASYKYKQS